jgi:hypothetical protein
MDVLTVEELSSLLDLLNQEDKSLETISAKFQKTFHKQDHFKVCCTLYVMLKDDLLQLSSRLAAFYLLCDLYPSDPLSSNPFLPIFINTLQKENQKQIVERNFLTCLLGSTSSIKELSKKSVKELKVNFADRKMKQPSVDLNGLRKLYLDRQPQVSPFRRAGISPIIPDPVEDLAGSSTTLRKLSTTHEAQSPQTVEKRLKEFQFLSFEPQFIRPPPPLLEPQADEVIWLNPEVYPHEVLWDPSFALDSTRINEVRTLMSKAFQESLLQPEQQKLLAELEADPKIVYHSGITPKKLPALVENNPLVAIEVLLKLMSSSQITEYFSVLVNMEMSLHSMEVVNRLTTAVELPTEFVHLYVSNCISSCENVKDKYMQNRLVRLVCVFLQSLIRNKIINVKDLFLEVQAFCVEFSRIREAAGLFRLLKTLEN